MPHHIATEQKQISPPECYAGKPKRKRAVTQRLAVFADKRLAEQKIRSGWFQNRVNTP